jgi:hypothetical protein
MALSVIGGKKNKEPQIKIFKVVQGDPDHIDQLNVLIANSWQITEIISLSGFLNMPGEAHYLLERVD